MDRLIANDDDDGGMCGLRILVVEDDLLLALSLKTALQRFGCEVVGPASRIRDAIDVARTAELDGAILDVDLRGRPVFPVADALAARGVPFIFSTGLGPGGGLLAAYRAPRLDKPYSDARLRQEMSRSFATHGPSQPIL